MKLGQRRFGIAKDDTQPASAEVFKNYLLAAKEVVSNREVIYLTGVAEGFSEAIKRLLIGPASNRKSLR